MAKLKINLSEILLIIEGNCYQKEIVVFVANLVKINSVSKFSLIFITYFYNKILICSFIILKYN